jgi:hypothetical protein
MTTTYPYDFFLSSSFDKRQDICIILLRWTVFASPPTTSLFFSMTEGEGRRQQDEGF